MIRLALNLKSSAEILGTESATLLELVKRGRVAGIIRLGDQWRISVFTLARLLDTTPDILLEFIENYVLGQMMEEVVDDEWLEGQEGREVYQSYLVEAGEYGTHALFARNSPRFAVE